MLRKLDLSFALVVPQQQATDIVIVTLLRTAPNAFMPSDSISSICVGQSDIPFSRTARNLGAIFDSQLAMKEQVNKLSQLAYLEIRRIGSIRGQYLSFETTKTLVSSLVLSILLL